MTIQNLKCKGWDVELMHSHSFDINLPLELTTEYYCQTNLNWTNWMTNRQRIFVLILFDRFLAEMMQSVYF